MSYPDTQQDVHVKVDEWQISVFQMQPETYQDDIKGVRKRQEIHMTLEQAALLAARLTYLVAQAKEELEKDYE